MNDVQTQPEGRTVESTLRRLSVGVLVLFAVVLVAFLWVERNLASNLSLNDEVVVPARGAARQVERALGELAVRQSQVAGAANADEVKALADRSATEASLEEVRRGIDQVAVKLQEAGADLGEGYSKRFDNAFESFLAADDAYVQAHLEQRVVSSELDRSIAKVEKRLAGFLESTQGISGKMRFEYGSALRRIKRQLKSKGWSTGVRGAVEKEVLASSSRRNMVVGDVLGLASEMNRLAGKIGLVTNRDQLRSLYANELVPTSDRLRVALDELVFETEGEGEIEAIAGKLQDELRELEVMVVSKDEAGSLVSMKSRLLDARKAGQERMEEMVALAGEANHLSQDLVQAADTQSQTFSSELRAAGSIARFLLLAVVLLGAVGGVIGMKSVRTSLAQLRQTNDDLARLKDELTVLNQGLEAKVAERTAELDEKNKAMRIVLDNVEQGLASLDADGRVQGGTSARFDKWFHGALGKGFGEILRGVDSKVGFMFDLGWEEVQGGIMPLEVNLTQLPSRVEVGGRTLSFEYRAMSTDASGDVPLQTLVVVTDVTEQIERQRAEAAEREFANVFRQLIRDRSSFEEFFDDACSIVSGLEEAKDYDLCFRSIHTLKGNCALVGLERVTSYCHTLESEMVDAERMPTAEELQGLAEVWEETASRIRSLLDQGSDERLHVTRVDLERLLADARRLKAPESVVVQLSNWQNLPAGSRLDRLAEQGAALGERLGKGQIDVRMRGSEVRLPSEPLAPLWSSMAHVLRNAIDHGLEAPEDRIAAGKPAQGVLELGVEEVGDEVVISIADDGAGVAWERLAAKAKERGLPHIGHDALVEIMFADGISSRDDVSAVSGRGVGMSAVKAAVSRLGGQIEVTSAKGEGTEFKFRIPRSSLRPHGISQRPGAATGTLDLVAT